MKPMLSACLLPVLLGCLDPASATGQPALQPLVEAEEEVYTFTPANNGAGPMWCSGSTCLVRIGNRTFASGLETVADAQPLNNCRWMLFERTAQGWIRRQVDSAGRTREPSPIAGFQDGRLYLSANPTLGSGPEPNGGPARPELIEFLASDTAGASRRLTPQWKGTPDFREHSYRSLAADGMGGELILFQNIGYTHAEWTFRSREGHWAAQGRLDWPWGSDYEKPQPIRVCYPNVALKDRAVHFCGVSDIVEPNPQWREFKRQLTGREWDYDFRRLFYTWSPDISREGFRPWVEIASRESTCGWISPGDLWIAPDGAVQLIWTERALDERLRAKFFPDLKQSHALRHAVVRDGKVISRRTLIEAVEGGANEIPGQARFQPLSDGRLVICCYVGGSVSENRVFELRPDGSPGPQVRVPLRQPFTSFFTATVRAGSEPSNHLELLGQQSGRANAIGYARIRL